MRVFLSGCYALLLSLVGCAPYFHQPLTTEKARLGAEVRAISDLKQLPDPPKDRIVVAVYKFRDQTGQYKPSQAGSSFSTAITQGATSILLRALEESRWFNPIERENLGNLLNERKIIRSSRAEYQELTGKKEPMLPSLLFAGVILEGGIISYDANMVTGGAGLRYFGAGASGQYRQDRVTVYLRAISTSTGEILKTVYTSKTILSQQVDASLFRFVNFKRLLETETGFTYNEPTEMAVKEAIEKSVQALVYEGIRDNLWVPGNPAERNGAGITQYFQEKNENQDMDVLGRVQRDRRAQLGLGLSGATVRYVGDLKNSQLRANGQLAVHYQPTPAARLGAVFHLGRFELGAGDYFRQTFNYAELAAHYRIFPRDRFTPYLLLGGGATTRADQSVGARVLPHVLGGAGVEVLLTDKVGLSLGSDARYYFSDNLDGIQLGKYNDYFWTARLGATFYFGRTLKLASGK
ncbi:curli production assembly/transport component CsgG [Hymenobacter luteus]|uniref:Curli production assembly/transport component CsgG n=2 Tax=Hymenobacter TaxID=89966 RepID=A0A7W9WCL1_9BACT|nr:MULTISPECIES: CsgG/HfaB family protein [Hymenobacter]MBB4603027.1 curli production assembly/transport component CsgG [Hymenobacter latericoloratus]MBB6061014.1 curli production assembly/transport component CsgG [Hymenobacter luteus]